MTTVRLTLDSVALQRWGGVSRYAVELTRAMRGLGSDVDLLPGLHINDYLSELPTRAWRLPTPLQLPGHRRVVRTINRRIEGRVARKHGSDAAPGVFIFHHTYYRGDIGVEDPTVRHVVTVYDMIHEELPQYYASDNPTTARKRRDCAAAAAICTISETTRAALISLFDVPREKVFVARPGVHVRSDRGRSRAEGSVLYVGRRDRYKDFRTLLTALARARRAPELVAFGGGPPTPDELAEIRRLGLTSRVTFAGGGDRPLDHLYQTAMLMVSTSLAEGFGMPTLEAMANGCPVILPDTPISREVADSAAAYFDPRSSDQLADQIERLASSTSLRSALSEDGLRRSRAFTWEACASATSRAHQYAAERAG